jgi:hypothetical protein
MLKRFSQTLFTLLTVFTLAPAAMALDFDPQELVGVWSGRFEVRGTETGGDVTLTIKEVAGNRVRGIIYFATRVLNPNFNQDMPFEGTLSDKTISTGRMTLTIFSSTSMTGEAPGQRAVTVMSLSKAKR